jgi:hypothetical protein
MSHVSVITQVPLKNLTAMGQAIAIIKRDRNINLELKIGPDQKIRGWRNTTAHRRYNATIQCPDLSADIGLAFMPDDTNQQAKEPVLKDNILQNGHFLLEGDLMLLGPLGPQMNLLTNLYSAVLIEPALRQLQSEQIEMQLLPDNQIILQNSR